MKEKTPVLQENITHEKDVRILRTQVQQPPVWINFHQRRTRHRRTRLTAFPISNENSKSTRNSEVEVAATAAAKLGTCTANVWYDCETKKTGRVFDSRRTNTKWTNCSKRSRQIYIFFSMRLRLRLEDESNGLFFREPLNPRMTTVASCFVTTHSTL